MNLNIKCPECGEAIKPIENDTHRGDVYECGCTHRTHKDVVNLLVAENAELKVEYEISVKAEYIPKQLEVEIERLTAELAKHKEALKVFAERNKCVLKEFDDDDFISDTGFRAIDFRRAAEVYGGDDE